MLDDLGIVEINTCPNTKHTCPFILRSLSKPIFIAAIKSDGSEYTIRPLAASRSSPNVYCCFYLFILGGIQKGKYMMSNLSNSTCNTTMFYKLLTFKHFSDSTEFIVTTSCMSTPASLSQHHLQSRVFACHTYSLLTKYSAQLEIKKCSRGNSAWLTCGQP